MYQIKIKKPVVKFLEKNKGQGFIQEFADALKKIEIDPYYKNLDIVKLQGSQNRFRLRIGKYRFLYRVDEGIILITFYDAGSRGDIYK